MNTVSICSAVFNVEGASLFQASSDSSFGNMARRVSRVKTLDGGASIEDLGFNWGDVAWSIIVDDPSEALVNRFRFMTEYETTITVATKQGVFTASPGALSIASGKLTLSLTIKEKVSY